MTTHEQECIIEELENICINNEYVLELLAKLKNELNEKIETYKNAYRIMSDAFENEVRKNRPQGDWIPVSERMPNNQEYIKNNGLFNVSDGNRSYSEWFDIYETEMFGEPTISGFRVDNAVIAWQQLPEPYKKEKEHDEF